MRPLRAPLVTLLSALLLLTAACSATSNTAHPRAPQLPAPPDSHVVAKGICDLDPALCANHPRESAATVGDYAYASGQVTAMEASARITRSPGLFSFGAGTPAPQASPQLPSAAAPQAPHDMIEVEARFSIQSDDIAASTERFRSIARAAGGTITLDSASQGGTASEATFEVRVPMAQYDSIVSALDSVGKVRAREVKATDVTKSFHDTELLLANQEAALKRYGEILKDAKTVTEVLEVEHQLERLRAQIDRLKGDLAWTQDKVLRATLRVRIFPSEAAPEAVFAPEATLYPGARGIILYDLRGPGQTYGYAGGGLSFAWKDVFGIKFSRAFVVDVDIAHAAFTNGPSASSYALLALAGSELYSGLLGGGRRTVLNPYLGWRMGFAETEARGDFAVGAVVGLDLLKTKSVILDLHLRALGLFGNDLGAHALIAPGLGMSVSF